jgi:hypothetical protein
MIDEVISQPEIQAVFGENAPAPKVLVSAIGRRRYVSVGNDEMDGPHQDTSSPVKLGAESDYYIKHLNRIKKDPSCIYKALPDKVYREMNRKMLENEIVTDVFRHAITADGKRVPGFAERTSLCLDFHTIKKWRKIAQPEKKMRSILVVGGSEFKPALLGAMKTGLFNTIIIDTALAIQLLAPEDRPDPYKSIPPIEKQLEAEPV